MNDITLGPLRLDDAPLLMELDHDPQCARWFDFPPITMDEQAHRSHAESVVHRWWKETADDIAHHFAIRLGERAIGVAALRRIGVGTGSLSYAVVAAERARGYATRATQLLVEFGLEELGLSRLELRTDFENVASQRVAERAGFTFERLDRRAHRFQNYPPFVDEERDEWVYVIEKSA